VLDPDDNNIEVVNHHREPRPDEAYKSAPEN
jgi:hypothetical protein